MTTNTTTLAQSTALVLETNNLRGGDDAELVSATLERLFRHLQAQTLPLASLAEVVVTHDGLDAKSRARLEDAAGRPLRFVALVDGAGYYEAKNRGFDATTTPIVAFADGDCWPEPGWLEALLDPFGEAAVQVVAGRTTYRDDLLGTAASTIDFLYFPSQAGAGHTRNFYANNVAFRREVFARFRYRPAPRVYRGHCQDLGFRLHAAHVPVCFAEAAHTIHRFPDSRRALLRLRLLRGADTVAMAPRLLRSVSPRLSALANVPVAAPLAVLAGRFAFSLGAVARRPSRTSRLACAAVVTGLSAVDAAGALARALRWSDFGVHDGGLVHDRLGYHGNGDHLREQVAHVAA
jgi:hypothetical protein